MLRNKPEGEEDFWRVPGGVAEICGTKAYCMQRKEPKNKSVNYSQMFGTLSCTLTNGNSVLSRYFPSHINFEEFQKVCEKNPEAKRETLRIYDIALRD